MPTLPPKRKQGFRLKASAQASEISFDLHTLGWRNFQELCTTIVGNIWGQTVQSFCPTNDAGRDGAFQGTWKQHPAVRAAKLSGRFVVQCKFSVKADKHLRLAGLADELPKAARLAEAGLAEIYVVMTNCALSARADVEIRTAFERLPGIRRCLIYGREAITRLIRESRPLRMLVPRVYGLGDLSQILDERAYEQAREILFTLRDELAKFVVTGAYNKSVRALNSQGFVILLGEPACGKSTIASTLALAAADRWGCHVIKVRDAAHFEERWNPHEPAQFFWVDDALGQTQYERDRALAWNRAFPALEAALRRGAKVIFTSRDYIYREAVGDLKGSAFPLLQESQVVVEVEKLSRRERERILYNHLRLGTQPPEFRAAVKPFLADVAAHPRFLPEIARRLGNPLFTRGLPLTRGGVLGFVERPRAWLREVVRNLDTANRAALSLVFMNGGRLRSPLQLRVEEEHALRLLNATAGTVVRALQAQDGTLVTAFQEGNKHWWGFKHPTIRDALGSLIVRERELMDIYLAGTPVESLVTEIVCAGVRLEGAKVVVPDDRYDALIARFKKVKDGGLDWDSLCQFLERRCDTEFLRRYLIAFPNFLDRLHPGSWAAYNPDSQVLARLFAFGLLPEGKRREFVKVASRLARQTPDAGFLQHPELRAMFRPGELRAARKRVREELLPALDEHIERWTADFDPEAEENPEAHFWWLRAALETYGQQFSRNQRVARRLERALARVDERVKELRKREHKKPEGELAPGDDEEDESETERSVFDDVDA